MYRKFLFNLPSLKPQRTKLRNDLTSEELILWSYLRKKQLNSSFRRQFSIGPYILDFYCPEKHLAIEIDGNHHKTQKQKEYDSYRTKYLKGLNIQVVRFWNQEINKNVREVVNKIKQNLCTSNL